MEYHSKKLKEVLSQFNSDEFGLTENEAKSRLLKSGLNVINDEYKLSPLKIFLGQFKSFLIYVLFAAAILSVMIKDYLDAGIILAIVILNSLVGFFQQYKAEKSIIELRKLMIHKSRVLRNNKLLLIDSKEIVLGDILILREGDRISADCRILEAENLQVNESILTGESLPVEKITDVLPEKTILAERKNMLYTGTSVLNGNGKALVVYTGMNTEFGKISKLLQRIEIPETPMQKKLNQFAKQISLIIIFLVFVVGIIGIIDGINYIEMMLTSVALAVSAIPEGLPTVITLGLAFASRTMLRKKVIIRRLPAAETLGSVTVICSDKTGTMTEEQMQVQEIYCNKKVYLKNKSGLFIGKNRVDLNYEKELFMLIKTSILCNNARFEEKEKLDGKIIKRYEIIGDPTESALILSALDLGVNKKYLSEKEPRIKEISFSSDRKMMSIIRKNSRKNIMYSKGASEVILSKCKSEYINGRFFLLNDKRKKELFNISKDMETKAYRVLSLAYKELDNEKEESLVFLGFVGMLDPPRKEVSNAINLCQKAGIKVKMITGDSLITAKTIALQIGIKGKAISGEELENMTDRQLKKEIKQIAVFARASPKQKLRIVEILKELGEEIAITGDGVNDVLALKKADIGIAMGERGSDVAREVADMILINDNFHSIVDAIEEGRTIYDNAKKVTKFLLAVNFSEILLIAFSIFFLRDDTGKILLPLLPIHILWMNLVTDSIPALALTKEKGEDVMNSPPRHEKSLMQGIFVYVLFTSLLVFLVEVLAFYIGISQGIVKARTLVLTADILFEFLFLFTIRSNKFITKSKILSNKYIFYAILSALSLHLIVLYTPLNILFKLTPLTLKDWIIILPLSISGLVFFETWKLIKKKNFP